MKNGDNKQGVSVLGVHLVHEYANALKFCGANSSKQKSIPVFGLEFLNSNPKQRLKGHCLKNKNVIDISYHLLLTNILN
ncbi:MAG: hypothetical protein LN569_04775 [Rickettsia endosymbiont of Labidopullus appendiculatus]|nr:hypothetical protein [Rickettsia endosymbiont of Labidopullus appendiculatus]